MPYIVRNTTNARPGEGLVMHKAPTLAKATAWLYDALEPIADDFHIDVDLKENGADCIAIFGRDARTYSINHVPESE